VDHLRDLERGLLLETDRAKRHAAISCALCYIQFRWEQLLEIVSNEQSSVQMLLLLADLNELLDDRRIHP